MNTLTERDLEVLRAVNRYRYLRTAQVKRLVFPENNDLQVTRRRLRTLLYKGCLGRVMPFIEPGQDSATVAYYLDKAGREFLTERGEEIVYSGAWAHVRPRFLEHVLDISEFRVSLELALKEHPMVEIRRFVADFELKSQRPKTGDGNVGHRNRYRYKLYDEVAHTGDGEKFVVYPDAMVILRGKGEAAKYQRLLFIEIDRGTESPTVLQRKVVGYGLYRKQETFRKFGAFQTFRVLVQTCSEKRMMNLRRQLVGVDGEDLVWVTDVGKVNESSLLDVPIWMDDKRTMKTLVRRNG